jgi:carbon monoxide dehydrogenase subunit G
VNFSATDVGAGVDRIEYLVTQSADFTPVDSSNWTVGNAVIVSQDGTNYVWMRAIDKAQPTGNKETPHRVVVHINSLGAVTISPIPAWNKGDVTVHISASLQPNQSIQYKVDGGDWVTSTANPTLVLVTAEGTHTVVARTAASDVVGPEASTTFSIDTTAPQVSASGADDAWHNAPVTVNFTATDTGSGVDSIQYSTDGGTTWTTGDKVVVSAEGTTTVSYRATDNAGNTSAVQSVTVKVDTTGPVTKAKLTYAKVNRAVALSYKATDNLSPQVGGVKVVVKNSHGTTVKTISVSALKNVNSWYSVKWTPKAKGTYRYYVYAKDLAGNAQSVRGWAKVIVK